jgi:hypothetical protein
MPRDPSADDPIDPGGFVDLPFPSRDPRLLVLKLLLQREGLARGTLRYGASVSEDGCKVAARIDIAVLVALALDGLPPWEVGKPVYTRRLTLYLREIVSRAPGLTYSLHRAWADAETPEAELAATRAILALRPDQV